MKKTSYLSLREKITLMITILLVSSVLLIGGVVYYQSQNMIISSLGTQALGVAEKASNLVDPVQYKELMENGDVDHPYYVELREKLNDLREKSGILYLYTMQKVDGKYIYRVDGMPWDSDNVGEYGQEEKSENISKKIERAFAGEKIAGGLIHTVDWGYLISVYVPIKAPGGEILGVVGGDFPADQIYKMSRHSLFITLVILALILVVGVLAGYFIAIGVSKPIEELVQVSEIVKDGNLAVKINIPERGDEIGRLYMVYMAMLGNIRSLVSAIQFKYAELLKRVEILTESTETAESSMTAIVSNINDVAEGSERQVSNLNKTAAEVGSIYSSINQIKGSSAEVKNLSAEAETRAVSGRNVLSIAKTQIDEINQQAGNSAGIIHALGEKIEEVTDFVKIISSIAQQTNLLALNAAIESARAGQEGRGFAVVAKEIRSLAEESSAAAQEVSRIIGEIQAHSIEAVKSIEQTVAEVQSGVSAIGDADREFARVLTSNQEVNSNIAQVADGIKSITELFRKINEGINGVSIVSEEANATAEEVAEVVACERGNIQRIKDESKLLVKLAQDLNAEIKRFRL